MLKESPWLKMWVHPRETIRTVIEENPNKAIWWLASVYGISSLFNYFQTIATAHYTGLIAMLALVLVLASLWGYLFFSIWGAVILWTGKLLDGQGSFKTIRAAYAWSCVPMLGNIPIWILLTWFYSEFLFFGSPDQAVVSGQATLLLLLLLAKLVFTVWSIVLYLQALSEVQGYSIFRAIVNVILASLLMGIVALLLWSLCFYTMHLPMMGPAVH